MSQADFQAVGLNLGYVAPFASVRGRRRRRMMGIKGDRVQQSEKRGLTPLQPARCHPSPARRHASWPPFRDLGFRCV
ncbi:protein of unknown function [Magnetospira sp. QH-2]|nr:protein of unknown function [Magnetospira sp. QH-2]